MLIPSTCDSIQYEENYLMDYIESLSNLVKDTAFGGICSFYLQGDSSNTKKEQKVYLTLLYLHTRLHGFTYILIYHSEDLKHRFTRIFLTYVYKSTVACRHVARQRPRNKQLDNDP
jgi:hypothetical protein